MTHWGREQRHKLMQILDAIAVATESMSAVSPSTVSSSAAPRWRCAGSVASR